MPTTPDWIGLRLDPLDTLFFRDGRPFDAATRATGGLPQPQTLAGAIRTALLARTAFDFAGFATRRKHEEQDIETALKNSGAPGHIIGANFRGPWLALAPDDKPLSPLLPMPETLKRGRDGGWSVAKPVAGVPGWSDPDGLKPLWRKVPADPKAEAEYLTLAGLKAFLAGGTDGFETARQEGLTVADHRIGIEVDKDTLTSADGMLYAISLLAARPKRKGQPAVCLYAEIGGDVARFFAEPLIVPFGGEGKYVKVTKVDAQDWPAPQADVAHSMWYLATPTFLSWRGNSKRSLPSIGHAVVAAASGAGVPVSGWDVARNGPKRTRFAVPAGAVYFCTGGRTADDFLSGDNGTHAEHLRQVGWGFALQGTWEGLPK